MSYKEYSQLFEIEGNFSSTELVFKRANELLRILHLIDFDVFLPTIGKNLQRPYVWNVQQEQELIYSILVGRYIPPIKYISLINPNGSSQDLIEIIDGKQRLNAIIRFLQDKFKIQLGSENFLYSELSTDFKSAIGNYHVCGQCLHQHFDKNNNIVQISDDVKIKWFCLINFSGTAQEKNHMDSLMSL